MKYAKIAMFLVGGLLVGAARAFPQWSHMLDSAGAALLALPLKIDAMLPGAKS